MEKLQYPIGRFSEPTNYTQSIRKEFITTLKEAPIAFQKLVSSLSEEQLITPYREGGWTPKQVVHHVADSHMNSMIRVKLALTEVNPTIKPYDENSWITLKDSNIDVSSSLKIIEGVHERYVILFESLKEEQFQRTFYHPENKASITIDCALALYAWHTKHHLGHIKSVKDRF